MVIDCVYLVLIFMVGEDMSETILSFELSETILSFESDKTVSSQV